MRMNIVAGNELAFWLRNLHLLTVDMLRMSSDSLSQHQAASQRDLCQLACAELISVLHMRLVTWPWHPPKKYPSWLRPSPELWHVMHWSQIQVQAHQT
jgi:hypothetical protein